MKKVFIVFLFVIGTLTLLAYFNNNATAKTTQEETFALLNLITAIISYVGVFLTIQSYVIEAHVKNLIVVLKEATNLISSLDNKQKDL